LTRWKEGFVQYCSLPATCLLAEKEWVLETWLLTCCNWRAFVLIRVTAVLGLAISAVFGLAGGGGAASVATAAGPKHPSASCPSGCVAAAELLGSTICILCWLMLVGREGQLHWNGAKEKMPLCWCAPRNWPTEQAVQGGIECEVEPGCLGLVDDPTNSFCLAQAPKRIKTDMLLPPEPVASIEQKLQVPRILQSPRLQSGNLTESTPHKSWYSQCCVVPPGHWHLQLRKRLAVLPGHASLTVLVVTFLCLPFLLTAYISSSASKEI
jgi:hypothetical protein